MVLAVHYEYETALRIERGCIRVASRGDLRKDLACFPVEQRRGITIAVGAERSSARQWDDSVHVLTGDQLPGRLLGIQVHCRDTESSRDIKAPRRAIYGRVIQARVAVLMSDHLHQNHGLLSGKCMRADANHRTEAR